MMVTTSLASSVAGEQCPTGFYMCSAYYAGGCCRIGRNCDSTSCPSGDSTTIVATSGATIVASAFSTTTVGSGTAAAAQGTQGSCANGWFSCGADTGGGCCPSGYVCGSSCSATQSGVQAQPKQAPSEGSVVKWAGGFLVVGLASAIGMIWL